MAIIVEKQQLRVGRADVLDKTEAMEIARHKGKTDNYKRNIADHRLFKGYFPGYSKLFKENLNYLTWAILKAHTKNTAGKVTLRSSDPLDTPDINFHYFEEGNESVVDGIEFVRSMTAQYGKLIAEEELPGKDVQTRDEIRQFVKDRAWGHHASCTCPIEKRENGGVVDGDFRVYGTENLRIVDASVFPKIPGFFIVTSVYMVGEKASDVIIRDAKKR
jgi:choline dehydrogenase